MMFKSINFFSIETSSFFFSWTTLGRFQCQYSRSTCGSGLRESAEASYHEIKKKKKRREGTGRGGKIFTESDACRDSLSERAPPRQRNRKETSHEATGQWDVSPQLPGDDSRAWLPARTLEYASSPVKEEGFPERCSFSTACHADMSRRHVTQTYLD